MWGRVLRFSKNKIPGFLILVAFSSGYFRSLCGCGDGVGEEKSQEWQCPGDIECE